MITMEYVYQLVKDIKYPWADVIKWSLAYKKYNDWYIINYVTDNQYWEEINKELKLSCEQVEESNYFEKVLSAPIQDKWKTLLYMHWVTHEVTHFIAMTKDAGICSCIPYGYSEDNSAYQNLVEIFKEHAND